MNGFSLLIVLVCIGAIALVAWALYWAVAFAIALYQHLRSR